MEIIQRKNPLLGVFGTLSSWLPEDRNSDIVTNLGESTIAMMLKKDPRCCGFKARKYSCLLDPSGALDPHQNSEDQIQELEGQIQIRNEIPIPAEIPSSNDSPIEEVKSIVSIRDTPSLPDLTFWVVVIGSAVTVMVAYFKATELFKDNVFEIPLVLMQVIVGLLGGRVMEAMLPTGVFHIPGTELTFSLNPGHFNAKEHTLTFRTSFSSAPLVTKSLAIHSPYVYFSPNGSWISTA